jgi:hypothetical protein
MSRKKIFTLLICVAWAMTAGAQNSVESIRKAYQDVHKMIDQMTPDADGMWETPPEYFDLKVVQNLPGTGPHEEKIRMYYGELESEEEGNPYPPHYLRFTTAKYNFAAREFYEEYLYDDKGQVMFIYALTPDVGDELIPYELRMWFDGKRLLRFTAKKSTLKDVYSGLTIPELYLSEAERCQQRAQRYLLMFKGIDENTNL